MLQKVARESKFKMWLSQIASYISLNNILSMIVLKRVLKLCQRPIVYFGWSQDRIRGIKSGVQFKICLFKYNMIITPDLIPLIRSWDHPFYISFSYSNTCNSFYSYYNHIFRGSLSNIELFGVILSPWKTS